MLSIFPLLFTVRSGCFVPYWSVCYHKEWSSPSVVPPGSLVEPGLHSVRTGYQNGIWGQLQDSELFELSLLAFFHMLSLSLVQPVSVHAEQVSLDIQRGWTGQPWTQRGRSRPSWYLCFTIEITSSDPLSIVFSLFGHSQVWTVDICPPYSHCC